MTIKITCIHFIVIISTKPNVTTLYSKNLYSSFGFHIYSIESYCERNSFIIFSASVISDDFHK
jgi:hypothetical protein